MSKPFLTNNEIQLDLLFLIKFLTVSNWILLISTSYSNNNFAILSLSNLISQPKIELISSQLIFIFNPFFSKSWITGIQLFWTATLNAVLPFSYSNSKLYPFSIYLLTIISFSLEENFLDWIIVFKRDGW